MGKQTEKNQRKIQRTMKPKGESAVGTCEKEKGQPANHNHQSNLIQKKPDMVDGIKLNKTNQSEANMCNFQYHASWIMRMSALLRNPSHHLTTPTNLPVLWRHISQPRLAAENLREKRWPNVWQTSCYPPQRSHESTVFLLGVQLATFQWDRCGGHNNLIFFSLQKPLHRFI